MARDLLALRLLIVAFFLSGTGALIYQVIWQRMLGLFAGADSTSAALVVGAFLLGLGIGSLIASYLADRLTPRRAAPSAITRCARRRSRSSPWPARGSSMISSSAN